MTEDYRQRAVGHPDQCKHGVGHSHHQHIEYTARAAPTVLRYVSKAAAQLQRRLSMHCKPARTAASAFIPRRSTTPHLLYSELVHACCNELQGLELVANDATDAVIERLNELQLVRKP